MEPISFINTTPQFSKYQIETFGCPSYYGFYDFEVIETYESKVYCTDFKIEQQYYITKRVVHVYCRLERFQIILAQLMCMSLNVSNRIMKSDRWFDMIDEVAQLESNHWIETRKILKKYKFNTYYNRIPGILSLAKGDSSEHSNTLKYQAILKDFKKMHTHFEAFKNTKYAYFPNLRFVALKLMQYHQVYPNYDIPLAITKSKILSLEKTFDDIWLFINLKL